MLAFRGFEEGKDLRDIVLALGVTPEKVRALYREWREPDLEEHEVRLRRRAREQADRLREEEESRRHENDLERWAQTLARLQGGR
jgi:hypothetical protein